MQGTRNVITSQGEVSSATVEEELRFQTTGLVLFLDSHLISRVSRHLLGVSSKDQIPLLILMLRMIESKDG